MAKQGWTTGSARAAGGSRNYKLWAPATVEEGKASPLVMLLHGCTHGADEMAETSGMNEVAESNGFLVVYPEQSFFANLLKCWNWFDPKHQSRDSGEPSILAAIVEQVGSSHEIDLDRVYIAGVSAGGAMAVIAAATYPDLFAGVAVCGGAEFKAAGNVSAGLAVMQHGGPDPAQQGQAAFEAMKPGLANRSRRRMPVIVFHGSADERVAPVNAEQIIAQWTMTNTLLASQNGDGGFALSERIIDAQVPEGHPYSRRVYADQMGALLMESWIVEGMGHAWSGSPKKHKYGDPKGPRASGEIWRFFTESTSKASDFSARQKTSPEPSSEMTP